MGRATPASAPVSDTGGAAAMHTGFGRIMNRGQLLAVRARYGRDDFGSSGQYMADTFGLTPSFLCVLQLRDFPPAEGWRNGRHLELPMLARGDCHVLDLRNEWRTAVNHPFDNVHLHVTQAVLDEVADDLGSRKPDFTTPAHSGTPDMTLGHLAISLLPAFERPGEMSALFVDHVVSAAAIHLLEAYGGVASLRDGVRGGLAPWQLRRVRDLLMARLDGDIGIADLAAACGLSKAHFARAFRQSMGVPPHRWLLEQRVVRARNLLLETSDRIDAIALRCGFADQSHLNRVFTRAFGMPPGAWRRMRRS